MLVLKLSNIQSILDLEHNVWLEGIDTEYVSIVSTI